MLNISYRLNPKGTFFKECYKDIKNISEIKGKSLAITRWKSFLINSNINTDDSLNICNAIMVSILDFIKDFHDDREETEKDIWYSENIKGAKIPASGAKGSLNFNTIPIYYKDMVKHYFKTIVTKKSWSTCYEYLLRINYFFNYYYQNNYGDGFLEDMNRNDIEKYIFYVSNDRKDKAKTETSKYISWVRTFLEYI
nr:hypothetical protein [Clostridium estertheticum]